MEKICVQYKYKKRANYSYPFQKADRLFADYLLLNLEAVCDL